MSSSDTVNMAEIREETREVFERIMTRIQEDFELKLQDATASPKDREDWIKLNDSGRSRVIAQSTMAAIAYLYRVELAQWVENLMDMQNPGFKYHLHLSRIFHVAPLSLEDGD